MYPTPRSAGRTSIPIPAPLYFFQEKSTSLGNSRKPSAISLYSAESPRPPKTVPAFAPPSSPAINTSAHAFPSGYGSVLCSFTISAERSGIIKSTPITPPISAINAISKKEGGSLPVSDAHIKSAGNVKIAPAATDSPAEPIVCTILFSSTESRLNTTRMIPIETTAAGMDADTVIPTRSPRYALAPPKITASSTPIAIAVPVSSLFPPFFLFSFILHFPPCRIFPFLLNMRILVLPYTEKMHTPSGMSQPFSTP